MLPYAYDFNRDSLIENAIELIEAGIPIIQLHPMDDQGNCTCSDPNCTKIHPNTGEVKTLAGKHPMIKSWQNAPVPDTEPLKEQAIGSIEHHTHPSTTGLGAVLTDDIVIVDVDCKNGKQGQHSLNKLEHHIGQKLNDICGYKVISGSGAPSAHYWFRKPADMDVRKTLKEYPDIDFLHKGNYVVIQGSCHQSGGIYTSDDTINKITQAPDKLLAIIEREKIDFSDRPPVEAGACDMRDINQALEYIMAEHQGHVPYEDWFRVCMALHYETGGSQEGYELFDKWSSTGTNYSGAQDTYRKWQEGYKGASNKISGATILWMAQELGWEREYGVEVDLSAFINSLRQGEQAKIVSKEGNKLEFSHIPDELKNFTGITGMLMQWSLENSKKPSYLMSLAGVLAELSSRLGRDFKTDTDSFASIYQMVVAKTATGKEQIMRVINKSAESMMERYPNEINTMMTDATSASAMYSALEIMPRRCVVLDEIAHILEAVGSARGGNSELIGLTSFYLQVFGRLDGTYTPKSMSTRGLSKEDRKKVAKETDIIRRPAVSIVGMTTPVSFMNVLTRKMMQDGFINRFLMWFPQEGRQPIRLEKSKPIPESMWHWMERVTTRLAIQNKVSKSALVRDDPEHPLDPVVIQFKDTESEVVWREFEKECLDLADDVERFGFEDIYARAPEISIRIALILQLAEDADSVRIEPHIMRQACALVRFSKAEEVKCYMLDFSENETEKREKKIYNFICSFEGDGVSLQELYSSSACAGLKKQERDDLVKVLIDKEKILIQDNNEGGKGRPSNKKKFVFADKFAEYLED